jgi:hypothetical protein
MINKLQNKEQQILFQAFENIYMSNDSQASQTRILSPSKIWALEGGELYTVSLIWFREIETHSLAFCTCVAILSAATAGHLAVTDVGNETLNYTFHYCAQLIYYRINF